MGESNEVSIDVAASPEAVYAMVADLPRMGEWSPECVRCDWLGGATAATPGAKFRGRNRIGFRRWSTTGTVVTASPGEELTFDVTSVFGLPVARWTYRISADGNGGSTVVERWEERRGRLLKFLGLLASGVGERTEHNMAGMRATLARIKATAEA
ncbi:MAG TPA: SRPBCC family protein [Acidimicrobiales bacterium]|nr:SRPBCC family protein [Acidimicrobiales bacterium]